MADNCKEMLKQGCESIAKDLEELVGADYEEMCDYFQNSYDTKYIINGDHSYFAVRVMVAGGGPNIYINTWERRVEGYWWFDSAEAVISREACDAIDEFFAELYNCGC